MRGPVGCLGPPRGSWGGRSCAEQHPEAEIPHSGQGVPTSRPTPRCGMGRMKIPLCNVSTPPESGAGTERRGAQAELQQPPRSPPTGTRRDGRHLHGAQLRAAGPRPARVERSEPSELQTCRTGGAGRAASPHAGRAHRRGGGAGPGRAFSVGDAGSDGPGAARGRGGPHPALLFLLPARESVRFGVFFLRGFSPSGLPSRPAGRKSPSGRLAGLGGLGRPPPGSRHGPRSPQRNTAAGMGVGCLRGTAAGRHLKAASLLLTE